MFGNFCFNRIDNSDTTVDTTDNSGNITLGSEMSSTVLGVSISIPEQTQPTFTCSKLTIETLEQRVKYVQS